jgi:hypothetical protein
MHKGLDFKIIDTIDDHVDDLNSSDCGRSKYIVL